MGDSSVYILPISSQMSARSIFKLFSLGGSTPFYLAVVGGLWFFSHHAALTGALSFGGLMAVCYGIKLVYRKPRPDADTHKAGNSWFAWLDWASFPSVHSARAAALAVVVFTNWPLWLWVIAGILYVSAVGLSRIKLRRHFLTDVIGGVIIGALVALLLTKLNF